MTTRKRLMAATSTAALVAGGLFLTTAPAQAAPDSPACLSAQAQFEAALGEAGVSSALTVELSAALQDVLDAQASLQALEAAAVIDVAAVQPNLNIALQDLADAEANVRNAELALSAALGGLLVEANAELTAAVTAEGDAEDVLTDADAALALLIAGDPGYEAASEAVTNAELALDAAEAARIDAEAAVAVLTGGDLNAILAIEADLDALLGTDVAVINNLQLALDALNVANTDVLDAQAAVEVAANLDAILAANVTLDAAIAAVNDLEIDLDGLAIDVDELEVLYAESIAACSGDSITIDIDIDGAGGADVDVDGTDADVIVNVDDDRTGGPSGNGTNQGMNVQTAVPAATTSSSPMLGGAIVAGLGSLAAAGAWLRRKA